MSREERVFVILDTQVRFRGRSVPDVARRLGIHQSHVYNALRVKDISPTLMRAAVNAGWVGAERVRFAGDVDELLQEQLSEAARRHGLTNGELITLLALSGVTLDDF